MMVFVRIEKPACNGLGSGYRLPVPTVDEQQVFLGSLTNRERFIFLVTSLLLCFGPLDSPLVILLVPRGIRFELGWREGPIDTVAMLFFLASLLLVFLELVNCVCCFLQLSRLILVLPVAVDVADQASAALNSHAWMLLLDLDLYKRVRVIFVEIRRAKGHLWFSENRLF